MPTQMQKTSQLTNEEAHADRKWFVVDLEGKTLGRAASKIAHVLRGKHKPTWTPHVDSGDFVVAINAAKIKLTGNKLDDKYYYEHSGFPGGIKSLSAGAKLAQEPEELIRIAVRGMLPKGPLGRRMFKKFKAYATDKHEHTAQKPAPMDV